MALKDSVTSDSVDINGLEQSLEYNYEAMVEQLRVLYREKGQVIELRDYPRVKFNQLVPICPASPLGAPVGRSVVAEGRDWSLKGISVTSPEPFEVHSHLVVDFVIPGDVNHHVKMLCQVCRVESDRDGHVIGCEFLATLRD